MTLHGYGAPDMKEIHLLKGDKSLSIKKSGGGFHCSAEGTGVTLPLRACTTLCEFECTYEVFSKSNTE